MFGFAAETALISWSCQPGSCRPAFWSLMPRSVPSVPSSKAKSTTFFAVDAAATALAIDWVCQSGGTHSKRTDSGSTPLP